jgi:hypothetical protein
LMYSCVSSLKMGVVSVFIAGPAGYQKWEHAPEVPFTSHGFSLTACTSGTPGSCTPGRWKLLDNGPVRLAREKATANIVSSLIVCMFLKFSRRWFGHVILKRLSPARIQGKSRA